MGFFSKMKEKMFGDDMSSEIMKGAHDDGYVQLDADSSEKSAKFLVRPFILDDFENIKPILDALREGHTIALINIKTLKDKDLVELKRAINKLKKTCDAIDGDIAGFGDDWIAATPAFAHIHRGKAAEQKKEDVSEVTEFQD
ncbi:cell division protein SepF [Candidatus Woesearchaeota archaeon]|nr:cell division protein SepF [Candidatus Woesearchaeota archaeon]